MLTNLILVGVDTFLYFYPYKAYVAETLRQGRLPLWNPYLFMGAPLLANSQVGLFYPLNWPLIWLDAPKQVAWSIGIHITLAGIFMFAFVRLSLRLGWTGSLVAAILFAFGGYLGAQVEHINQLNAAAWLPLLFLLYDLGLARQKRRRWFWFLWLALVVAITLLAGHAQTVFISLFGLGLYALWQGISPRLDSKTANNEPGYRNNNSWPHRFARFSIRSFARRLIDTLWPLVLVSVAAVALAAIQLVPTAELSALSIRGGGLTFREVVSFSLPPTTLLYTLLPPLGLDLSQVWGEAFGERVAYVGVSGLLLALLGGLLAVRQGEARRFVFVAASGLTLSLGLYSGPLYLGLYLLVPGFDLFRVPARWLLLYAFGAAVLAGIGFDALKAPGRLRHYLNKSRPWLHARRWRLPIFVVLPIMLLVGLIIWKPPPVPALIAWAAILLLAIGLIFFAVRSTSSRTVQGVLVVLVLGELYVSAQSLSYNQPTAPQAFDSMRNAVAFLKGVAPSPATAGRPPDRFLSLSGILYDPGDLRELEQIFGNSLSAQALHRLIVVTKEKEVLFFNLPLLYGLHSVDGYDGGILPLSRFVRLQRLFLPPDELSLDGRLRERLQFVPPGRLLALLNTRWIITDKVFDVWIDDVFYDLQFPARLAAGQGIATTDVPNFPATAIGLVSHLDGAVELPAGTPVATLTVTWAGGHNQRFRLRAGAETAEGSYPIITAHPQAKIGVAWPYEAQGVDYVSVQPLDRTQAIVKISVEADLPTGQFVLRGLSLINEPTRTSRSIILSTEGRYRQVHSGDVKIYENLAVLPRAFIVHQAQVVENEDQAMAAMQDPHFDPAKKFVRLSAAGEGSGSITAGEPSLQEQVTFVGYEAERVKLAVKLNSPGWLVLTDADYPGWRVTVDGQPVAVLQANLAFRAVALPAGEHTVIFTFEPHSLQLGGLISGVALLLLGGGLGVTRKPNKDS